jgi:hypothetical protein
VTGVAKGVAVGVVLFVLAVPAGRAAPRASLYSGPGFDTCSAPSLTAMRSWLASPYRAVGIYIGGINRACPDGNLSAAWTASAVSIGWQLLPLYVGLQAPCVAPPGLALIDPSNAASEGAAAADDAIARAAVFAIPPGAPIYFDMEGYNTNSPSCTQAVQAFLGAWVARLRSQGFLAGVYGSAASTIRDLIPSAGNPATGPDAVWIANWNGNATVFGDKYVADGYWPNHQRIHQYAGGHRETYGGVTINIDTNIVDGPVVGSVTAAPPPAPPPPQPQGGTLTTSDGQATVSWPSTAFSGPATVTATPSRLPAAVDGFAANSYVLQLGAQGAGGAAIARFGAPVAIVLPTPGAGTVPALSTDGATWRPLAAATGTALVGDASYVRAADGSITISTLVPGSIGLLRDVGAPTRPATLSGRFVRGRLVLAWSTATDNSGTVAGYQIAVNGQPLATATGVSAPVRGFAPRTTSVFRVAAQDGAGNTGAASPAVVVRPLARPSGVPRRLPGWAFLLAAWQQAGHAGKRPAAPRAVPSWYWRWQNWRLHPFHVGLGR